MPLEKKSERALKILKTLTKEFPDAKCALHHDGPFQLLIATILSAQCTDNRVNMVTPYLFAEAPTPEAMLELGEEKIRDLIKSINFFNNKAKAIYKCCQILVSKYQSKVPDNMEALSSLPGVGRKTANVVLGNAFGVPGMVVDTHVTRLANRLKLLPKKMTDAVKIESELEKIIPAKWWVQTSHLLILHGRKTCTARSPQCGACRIFSLCPSAGRPADSWK